MHLGSSLPPGFGLSTAHIQILKCNRMLSATYFTLLGIITLVYTSLGWLRWFLLRWADSDRASSPEPCSNHILGTYCLRARSEPLQGHTKVDAGTGGYWEAWKATFVENLACESAIAVSVLGWMANVRREALLLCCTRSRVRGHRLGSGESRRWTGQPTVFRPGWL